MTALLLFLCLAQAGAALAQGAAGAPVSALWIPAGPPDAEALQALLSKRPELKLAVGVVAEELPAASTATLARLWQEGRIEPVLRLPGDPLLPLSPLARRELRPRLAAARQAFGRALGRPPAGFAPGGGALDEASASAAAATGLTWAVVAASSGAAALTQGFAPYAAGGLALIPARAALDPAAAASEEALLVFDEGSGLAAPGSSLAAIDALAASLGGARPWTLPAAPPTPPAPGPGRPGEPFRAGSLAGRSPAVPAVNGAMGGAGLPEGRSWAGDLAFWNGRPAQAQTLARIAEAAEALGRYQNSGSAALSVLDGASALLYGMEASRGLAQAEAGEGELAGRLTRFYSLIGQRPPEDLVASTSTALAAGLVSIEAAPGRVVFSNAQVPPAEGELPLPCAIESVEVSFDTATIAFAVTLGSSTWPAESSVAVYVDINRRPGAGSQRLLPPFPGFLPAADAWDFVIEMSPADATLQRAQRATPPAPFDHDWEPASRRIAARIPAAKLRGRPGYWGYFTSCARASKEAPAILAVLGSLKEQEQLRGPKPKARPKFSALRLTPELAAKTIEPPAE